MSGLHDPESDRRDISMWLLVGGIVVGLVLFVWLVLSLLPGTTASDDTSANTPATPPPLVEVPVPPSGAPLTPPVTPPATSPAQGPTESAQGPDLVERFPLGERQLHDRANDDRRSAFGEVGAHCFADEVCGDVPDGAKPLNDDVAGRTGGGLLGGRSGGSSGGGSGSGGGAGSGTGGSGSGDAGSGGVPGVNTPSAPSVGGDLLGGIRDDARQREAAKRAAQDAVRVPVGQRGPHCFVGEVCPPIPSGNNAGGGTPGGTTDGPTVPCGTLGVHSRVGEVQTCIDDVDTRVGIVPTSQAGVVPVSGGALPPGSGATGAAPTFQVGGACFQVIGQSGATWTVRAIACPR